MEINTTDPYNGSSAVHSFEEMSTADKAAEIFTKPVEVTSIIICIVGLIANCFSITATAHIPRGQTTHSKLIISLGVSDSLILAAILLHNLMFIFSSWDDCTKMTKRLILDIALLATLINLLVMAVDHYLAIVKPLHYRRFMSNFRGNCLIVFIWVFSIGIGVVDIIIGLFRKAQTSRPFCTAISEDEFEFELVIIGFIFIVLLVIVVIYTIIYVLVKRLMVRDRMMYQDEMHGYKAIITTMLIIGTFTLFWAPNGIFQVYMYVKIKSDMMFVLQHINEFTLANDIIFLILQLNSIADPLIYAIRLRDVQRGYKVIFYKLFPNHRYSINEEEFRQHHLSITSCRIDTNPSIIPDGAGSPKDVHKNLLGDDIERRSGESSLISYKHHNASKKYENSTFNDYDINIGNVKKNQIDAEDYGIDCESDKMNDVEIANNNEANNMDEDSVFAYTHITGDETDENVSQTTETLQLSPVSENDTGNSA